MTQYSAYPTTRSMQAFSRPGQYPTTPVQSPQSMAPIPQQQPPAGQYSQASIHYQNFQPPQQQQQAHHQPPVQTYNHYNHYSQGSPREQQYQQQQYHQYQQQQQQQQQKQQQQQQNGGNGRLSFSSELIASLRNFFDAVDTDHSGALSCEELQRALMNGVDWTPFNMETVRMMINMFDQDSSGDITFNEFMGLWSYIERWKKCFMMYDLDGSGTIDKAELYKAMHGFGYNLSESIIDLILTKYDVRGHGAITFDNFVQACVTVQTLTDAFRRIDIAGTGVVTMSYEQFLALVISNR
ncbi:Programmed cell death protein 6 [Actinomortierella wolfii]|nr:Programmed cell death protein 6 [Actinomortierella wolfii]